MSTFDIVKGVLGMIWDVVAIVVALFACFAWVIGRQDRVARLSSKLDRLADALDVDLYSDEVDDDEDDESTAAAPQPAHQPQTPPPVPQ